MTNAELQRLAEGDRVWCVEVETHRGHKVQCRLFTGRVGRSPVTQQLTIRDGSGCFVHESKAFRTQEELCQVMSERFQRAMEKLSEDCLTLGEIDNR